MKLKLANMSRAYLLAFEDSDSEDEYVVRRPRWMRDREDHFHSRSIKLFFSVC